MDILCMRRASRLAPAHSIAGLGCLLQFRIFVQSVGRKPHPLAEYHAEVVSLLINSCDGFRRCLRIELLIAACAMPARFARLCFGRFDWLAAREVVLLGDFRESLRNNGFSGLGFVVKTGSSFRLAKGLARSFMQHLRSLSLPDLLSYRPPLPEAAPRLPRRI